MFHCCHVGIACGILKGGMDERGDTYSKVSMMGAKGGSRCAPEIRANPVLDVVFRGLDVNPRS